MPRMGFLMLFLLISIELTQMFEMSAWKTLSHNATRPFRKRTMKIHFGVCGGTFNAHFSAMAALWLVSNASRLLRSYHSNTTLRLVFPKLRMSSMLQQKNNLASFSQFYDLSRLRKQWEHPFFQLSNSVGPSCQKLLKLRFESLSEAPRLLADKLTQWPHNCAFLQVFSFRRRQYEDCMLYLALSVESLPLMLSFPVDLPFHPKFYPIAQRALNQMKKPFDAIHLRVESDYMKHFRGTVWVLNGTVLDECLQRHGWSPSRNRLVYLSVGQTALKYPEIETWLHSTPFALVRRDQVFATTGHLRREEWGIVEALFCIEAERYAGVLNSTRSMYVHLMRMLKGKSSEIADFDWDVDCPTALIPAPLSVSLKSRLFQEFQFVTTNP